MKGLKSFLSLFSFGKSKRRHTRNKKQKKRYTRRINRRTMKGVMKGGWGEAMQPMPNIMKGVMKGGWGSLEISTL